jgi:hypothetical protein
MSKPCCIFKPHPSKEETLCMEIEIVDDLALFLGLFPVYREIYEFIL